MDYLDSKKLTIILGELDPDLVKCEQCNEYAPLDAVHIYKTPITNKSHCYCNNCEMENEITASSG